MTIYALIQVELSRGWMSLSGVLNTHSISAWMIKTYGTEEQKRRYLPRMATGELHCGYSMTEPHAGSDVQAIRTRAVRDGDDYLITGQKMWATNGLESSMMMLLAKTDPDAEPRAPGDDGVHRREGAVGGRATRAHRAAQAAQARLQGRGDDRGRLRRLPVPERRVLGGEAGIGQGFKQFLGGVEVGRVNVAARAVGIATAALEEATKYARERRRSAGRSQAPADPGKLARDGDEPAGGAAAAGPRCAAKDAGERADLEAGIAK